MIYKAHKETLYKLKELLGIGADCLECEWFKRNRCTKDYPDVCSVCSAIDDLLNGDVMLEYDTEVTF